MTVALLIVLPLAVGIAAGVILDVLADRQQIARDARLAVAQLHGTVQLQEALVDHAMVMDHVTGDLPGRLDALRLEGEGQLQTYRELVSPNGGTIATVVLAAWILAVVFWQAARTRRAAALAEADRRSEARFRSLVQNASDVIVVVEPDTTIAYHSPSAERMLRGVGTGHSRPRLVDVVHQDERTVFLRSSKPCPSRTVTMTPSPSGSRLWMAGGWMSRWWPATCWAILRSAAWC
jgi:PAS domain-containing protein